MNKIRLIEINSQLQIIPVTDDAASHDSLPIFFSIATSPASHARTAQKYIGRSLLDLRCWVSKFFLLAQEFHRGNTIFFAQKLRAEFESK